MVVYGYGRVVGWVPGHVPGPVPRLLSFHLAYWSFHLAYWSFLLANWSPSTSPTDLLRPRQLVSNDGSSPLQGPPRAPSGARQRVVRLRIEPPPRALSRARQREEATSQRARFSRVRPRTPRYAVAQHPPQNLSHYCTTTIQSRTGLGD